MSAEYLDNDFSPHLQPLTETIIATIQTHKKLSFYQLKQRPSARIGAWVGSGWPAPIGAVQGLASRGEGLWMVTHLDPLSIGGVAYRGPHRASWLLQCASQQLGIPIVLPFWSRGLYIARDFQTNYTMLNYNTWKKKFKR